MVREMAQAFEEILGVKVAEKDLQKVQARVIQQFGGERVYVPKRANFVVGDRFDLSGGVADVMRRYRVSRTTVWRLRSRKG